MNDGKQRIEYESAHTAKCMEENTDEFKSEHKEELNSEHKKEFEPEHKVEFKSERRAARKTEHTSKYNGGGTPLIWLRSLLVGERCAVCGENVTGGVALICSGCSEELEKAMAGICKKCGSCHYGCLCSVPALRDAGCEYLVKLVGYDPSKPTSAVNKMIFRLKRRRDLMLHSYLAGLLAVPLERIMKARGLTRENCVVTFVPRSRIKYQRTGVDQASALAHVLARKAGLKCVSLLRRKEEGTAQKFLGLKERERNAARSYSSKRTVKPGTSVILVDDLVTTGATMCECTKLLRKAGADAIYGVCIARTARSGKEE